LKSEVFFSVAVAAAAAAAAAAAGKDYKSQAIAR
jgi:hypothetical protein